MQSQNRVIALPWWRALASALGALALGLGASGCPRPSSTGSPSEPDELSLECPQHICGQNDPRLNDHRFSVFHLGGERAPSTGSAYLGFQDPAGQRLTLKVMPRGEMLGIYDDGRELRGQALIGSQLSVELRGQDGKRLPRVIRIKGITTAKRLSRDDTPLLRYWLSYGPPEQPERMPLCKGQDSADLGALLIRDERYSPKNLEIAVPYGDPRAHDWITFLCRDHALEKMKRMSYEPGRPPDDPYFTTPAERNATIKMITAAYCLNRDDEAASFTKPGTEIFWQNDAGWMVMGAPPSLSVMGHEIEAYWDENGAVCLSSRRAKDTRGDDASRCWRNLPVCNGEPPRWEWVTYVPVPP
jgi:ADYC domain